MSAMKNPCAANVVNETQTTWQMSAMTCTNAVTVAKKKKKETAFDGLYERGKKAKRDYVYKTHERHLQ